MCLALTCSGELFPCEHQGHPARISGVILKAALKTTLTSSKRLFEQFDVFVRIEESGGVTHVAHADHFHIAPK